MNDNHESTITVFVATIMIALTLSAAVCLFPLKVIAADKPEAGTLSLVFENDLFYDSDRHYTNGVRISWLVGPNKTPDWVVQTARRFPLFRKSLMSGRSIALARICIHPRTSPMRILRSTPAHMQDGCTVLSDWPLRQEGNLTRSHFPLAWWGRHRLPRRRRRQSTRSQVRMSPEAGILS